MEWRNVNEVSEEVKIVKFHPTILKQAETHQDFFVEIIFVGLYLM